jgi:hypothetical protein
LPALKPSSRASPNLRLRAAFLLRSPKAGLSLVQEFVKVVAPKPGKGNLHLRIDQIASIRDGDGFAVTLCSGIIYEWDKSQAAIARDAILGTLGMDEQ